MLGGFVTEQKKKRIIITFEHDAQAVGLLIEYSDCTITETCNYSLMMTEE